jgi:hypothetical protein
MMSNVFPSIGVLPEQLAKQTYENIEHFSSKSIYYNGCFALGAVSVDNGKGGGFEKIHGEHALTLNGRTHHFLPGTGSYGGLEFFTFDAASLLCLYGNSLNSTTSRYGQNIDEQILLRLFNELKWSNHLVQECEFIGQTTNETELIDDEACRRFISTINQQTNYFDIAAITSLSRTGNRIMKYQIKGSEYSTNIQMFDPLLEPLSYPLFFPWADGGWGINCGIHFTDYLCCRMLMPDQIRITIPHEEDFAEIDVMNLLSEDDVINEMRPVLLQNKSGTHHIPVNRFQCQARLGQMYFTGMRK